MDERKRQIERGETILGIELGSTRIKAVLIDSHNEPIAQGGHTWENRLVDGVWTYSLKAIEEGLQAAFDSLGEDVKTRYDVVLKRTTALAISAMMHGYLAFDKEDNLLVPFERGGTMTEKAAEDLKPLRLSGSERWSISHHQAILNRKNTFRESPRSRPWRDMSITA